MKAKDLEHLKMLAEDDFMGACMWAEDNIKELSEFFDTWAAHCGASRATFIGHTVRMLVGANSRLNP